MRPIPQIRETPLWTWQILTGLVILLLAGLHLVIMHLPHLLPLGAFNPTSSDPLAWANVTHRARQVFFVVTYVLLAATALFHGLNGLRTVLFEVVAAPRARSVIVAVLAALGLVLLVLGTWAALAARGTALAAL